MRFRPILGAKVSNLSEVELPCFASYKIDGWRAIWQGREFFSRTLTTIPNRYVQQLFYGLIRNACATCAGWDGELVLGAPNEGNVFNRTETLLKAVNRPIPEDQTIHWFVFDNCHAFGGFENRFSTLSDIPPHIVKLDHKLITTYEELTQFEEHAVEQGYEGIVCRAPDGEYKYGRSTLKEQLLLKIKRFTDFEGKVVDFNELHSDANEATLDKRGYTHRSSHKENKIPMGCLGSLLVELTEPAEMAGLRVRVGSGFTQLDRAEVWNNRDKYLGLKVRGVFLKTGTKTLPRHPIWKSFASGLDK